MENWGQALSLEKPQVGKTGQGHIGFIWFHSGHPASLNVIVQRLQGAGPICHGLRALFIYLKMLWRAAVQSYKQTHYFALVDSTLQQSRR